ncbi:hypothetical protein J2W15_002937 [Pseudarthrobacter sulfonivorans]|nr:hypothetical protein [Pseudarthrobacter sulfonivorans]
MKKMEAPRFSAVYAGLGIVLWLVLAGIDIADNGASWRTVGYALLLAGSIFIFVRAIDTLRRQKSEGRVDGT